ncbi:hypothetical protein BJ508DRAFT_411927 [Ascobolus immersus RN42]|uniref:Copper acquisition factor BIM1-like domain-containing protein n=1 Tax=Ascobolus immersus RN42 TaxID=1160509 RepID=A0A3N4IV79_ASCIM|nr:hypothetical protein BJ508DRAFT_411927 [Ascobolus immersus RN42]
MQFTTLAALLASATVASAHFSVDFPYWRGDSFATQWNYPCGGVDQTVSGNNRTLWPLEGGKVVFNPTHDHAQTFLNIGLGNNVTRFSVPLLPSFNQTGKGTFCFDTIQIPELIKANITEGTNASLQIIQLSATGGALYNCMDITFSKDAKDPESCSNSTDVGEAPFAFGGVDLLPATEGSDSNGKGDDKKDDDNKESAAVGLKASGALAALTMAVVAGLML